MPAFRSHGEATVGHRPPAYVVILMWSSAGTTSTWKPGWRCDGTAGTNVPHKRCEARCPSPRCNGLLQRIRVDHSSNPIRSYPIRSDPIQSDPINVYLNPLSQKFLCLARNSMPLCRWQKSWASHEIADSFCEIVDLYIYICT